MKKLCIKTVLSGIFVLLTAQALFAQENTDGLELDLFKSAMSTEELKRWSNLFLQLKIQQKACEIQISSQLLPLGCYRELHLKVKIYEIIKSSFGHYGFATTSKLTDFLPQQADRLRIDKQCLAIVRETKEVELTKESELLMGRPCLQQAREKIKINRYKAGLD